MVETAKSVRPLTQRVDHLVGVRYEATPFIEPTGGFPSSPTGEDCAALKATATKGRPDAMIADAEKRRSAVSGSWPTRRGRAASRWRTVVYLTREPGAPG